MTDAELFDVLDLDRPELQVVKTAVASNDLTAAKRELARHIRERKTPRWYFSWHENAVPTQKPEDFPKAQALLRHEFTFGFGGAPDFSITLGDQIDWSANASEGEYKTHLWNESLNRHFHFSDLVEAYVGTGDEQFAEGLVLPGRSKFPYTLSGRPV